MRTPILIAVDLPKSITEEEMDFEGDIQAQIDHMWFDSPFMTFSDIDKEFKDIDELCQDYVRNFGHGCQMIRDWYQRWKPAIEEAIMNSRVVLC